MSSIIVLSVLSLLLQVDTTRLERIPLHERLQRTPVEYLTPEVKGDEYCRPVGRSQQATPTRSLSSSRDDVLSMSEASVGSSTCESEQQVHITLGNDKNSMIVSFISNNSSTLSRVAYSQSKDSLLSHPKTPHDSSNSPMNVLSAINPQGPATYSQLLYVVGNLLSPSMGAPLQTNEYVASLEDTSSWAFDNATKEHWANYRVVPKNKAATGFGLYSNPYMYYDSPFIHTVTLTNLKQGIMYYYQPEGSCKVFHFTLPHTSSSSAHAESMTVNDKESNDKESSNDKMHPFTIGMVVDLGQTLISNASITALVAMDPDVVLLAGDLCYADGWTPLWDSFGELIEPLAAHVPLLTTGGNHEFTSGETWQSYSARYPTPYSQSGSTSFGYWGREIGGGVHVIALNSYAGYSSKSHQYKWLVNYLKTRIDRVRTPWLVVMFHSPIYNTNTGHWREGELFRLSIEPLLYQYGVDIILAGHVHAYERTHEVYNNLPNPCGFVHLTVGDGGNYEGAYVPWRNLTNSKDAAWSAFREASFGVAEVKVLSDTQVHFSWFRHACQSAYSTNYGQNFSDACVTIGDNSAQKMMVVDPVTITKPSKTQCPNRWKSSESLDASSTSTTNSHQSSPSLEKDMIGSTTATTTTSAGSTGTIDNSSMKMLSALTILLFVGCVILAALLYSQLRQNKAIETFIRLPMEDASISSRKSNDESTTNPMVISQSSVHAIEMQNGV